MTSNTKIARTDRALFTALALFLVTAGAAFGVTLGGVVVPKPEARAPEFTTALMALAEEHRCLSEALYFEARGESEAGRKAVAEVVFARLKSARHGNSLCAVVYEGSDKSGCQFSFTCNGDLMRPRESLAWNKAEDLAAQILTQQVTLNDATGGATNYHAVWVSPYWAPSLKKTARIGNHIFYRAPGAES